MEHADVSRALAAAISEAVELGLDANDCIVLQNSNRLTVRLTPCDVIARIAIRTGRNDDGPAFELETARHLAEADCPVAVLEPRVESRVYVRDGCAITYWKYYEALPAADTPHDGICGSAPSPPRRPQKAQSARAPFHRPGWGSAGDRRGHSAKSRSR